MAAVEFQALVPNADRTAVLVDGTQLPVVRVEDDTRVVRVAIETFEREHGLDAPFLRVAQTKNHTAVLEFDSAAAAAISPSL